MFGIQNSEKGMVVGYLGLDQFVSNEYYKDLIALNTGRNALVYLINARKIKKIYLPYFLCDVVHKMCRRVKLEFECYSVGFDFLPQFKRELTSGEYIYIVNYYGQLSNEQIISLQEQYRNVIIDNVHAFFQPPAPGIDTIYSCRKFFGVPDGAYLSTAAKLSENLPVDVSMNRMQHVLGRFEVDPLGYYDCFKSTDDSYETLPLMKMSKLTHNILGVIDYESVCKQREINYAVLDENLASYNLLELKRPVGPFSYPLSIQNADFVRKKLVEKNIYIPTFWPNALSSGDPLAAELASAILPLPCDQRYNSEDMHTLVRLLKQLL